MLYISHFSSSPFSDGTLGDYSKMLHQQHRLFGVKSEHGDTCDAFTEQGDFYDLRDKIT
jgi:hypothetical protein